MWAVLGNMTVTNDSSVCETELASSWFGNHVAHRELGFGICDFALLYSSDRDSPFVFVIATSLVGAIVPTELLVRATTTSGSPFLRFLF